MALTSKKRIAAGSTHFPNLEKKAAGDQESGSKVKNHYEAQDLLVDPQDELEGTSTHTPIEASSDKLPKAKKVQAEVDLDEDLNIDSLDEVDALYEDGEEGGDDLSSILDDAEDAATDDELEEATEVEGELDSDEGDDEVEEETVLDDNSVDSDSLAGPDVDEPSLEAEEDADEVFSAEGIPLVDADGIADEVDDADEDLTVAAIGASVHVIRSNRIIASMTKKLAAAADKLDIYQEDMFPSIVCAEVQKAGLRKGLTGLGFQLATVNVESSKAVKAAFAQKVTAAQIKANKVAQERTASLTQCLAIASVGINRQFFKDAPNTLQAGLINELQAMGVRGAAKLVKAAFARYGIEYANTLITLANKLADQPEATRDQFAEALDLTSDDPVETDDSDDDLQDDFDPESESEELEVPSTVSAALSRPMHRVKSTQVKSGVSGSGSVNEILSGTKPLPFGL